MAANVTPRQRGDSYQALYFWILACDLLKDASRERKIVWESSGVPGFDDIILYDEKISSQEKATKIKYFQLKYHVANDEFINHTSLISSDFIGTSNSTILGRW
jgi:hypothetical protein